MPLSLTLHQGDITKQEADVIKRLTQEDGQRLRSLRLRSLLDAPEAFGGTHAEALLRTDESWTQQIKDMPHFVAVSGENDVGLVRCCRDEEDHKTLCLMSMWVAPEARGTGMAGALIDALVAWAREHAFERVILDVTNDNLPALSLYEKKGFRPTGRVGSHPPPRDHVKEHERELVLGRTLGSS